MTSAVPLRFAEAVARHYALFSGRVMLAPLVGGSELPYRLLCREYGADVTFTEMCVAEYYLQQDHKYTKGYTFQFAPEDAPCLLQLAGCEAASLLALAAAPTLAGHVAALNINAGCPQSFAMEKGYGAGMWARPEHMVAVMRELVAGCALPVSMKIRLHESPAATIRIMQELVGVGVSAFIVHPRYWWQKGSRAGQADWAALAQIRAAFPAIPIVGNGGVCSYADIATMKAQTGVDGVMIGYPALANPGVFSPQQPPLAQMLSRFVHHCRAIRTPWIGVLRHVAWMLPKGTEKEPLFACQDLVRIHSNI